MITWYFFLIFLAIFNNSHSFSFSYLKDAAHYAKCVVTECCNDKYIVGNLKKLQLKMDRQLFGQNIVKEVVVNAIRDHWENVYSPKALVLSFHGSPGTGKNYVSKMIVDSLYKEGSMSKYVHIFPGRSVFPRKDREKVDEYKENLYSWIKGNISQCEKQIFIFDEVDKIAPSILNGIKPLMDYHDRIEKLNYRKSIFIFLSNTGFESINDHYISLWKSGIKRNDIKLKDFEKLIKEGAFNEEGGFHHSDTIKSNLIDHYIPFLPLELEHVRSCIYREFLKRGINRFKESDVLEVLEEVEWGPHPEDLFSTSGCKRLSGRVGIIAQRNYRISLQDEL